jgi:ATP-dependent DNA helicase RecQ
MTDVEEEAPDCPDCGGPMEVRRARRGQNAGGLFWGCLDYPDCRGTRDHSSSENGPADAAALAQQPGPPPDCPKGHGPMRLKIARKGPKAGRPFWSCSTFPACNATLDADLPVSSHDTGNRPRRDLPVAWMDGTLDRPGWTCWYTSVGGSLRCFADSRELGERVGQSWIARTETSSGGNPDVQRVVGLCRKILQRGAAPPIDPRAERALLENLGLADRLRPSALPGDLSFRLDRPPDLAVLERIVGRGEPDLRTDPELSLDSDVERLFLEERACGALAAEAARWIDPQASLEALAGGGDAIGRRVDFLISAPWAPPVVVEIDGAQHGDSVAVDEERDALLSATGLDVLRPTAVAVRERSGSWIEEVRSRVPAFDASDDELAAALVYGPAQVHRCALALYTAVEAGFLQGSRWVIDVHDELDLLDDLVSPYLGLFAAVDRLWGGDLAPDHVVLTVNGRARRLMREGVGYVDHGVCDPEQPMVSIWLEPGRSAIEILPDADVPAVVVRSAFLPVRIANPVYEGSRRIGVRTEGEEVEEALVFLLRAVFAKETFREGQLDALFEVIEGRDCAVLLPTGAGKSLIYQLAGLVLPGRTLIIDPLVSLMEDQVEGLQLNGVDRVALLSSYQTMQGQADAILASISSGEALFVFVSPERLQQQRFRTALRTLAQVSPINMAVVDEAHCVSEWGHDFRTAYLNLGRVLRDVCRDADGTSPPLLALTGTASRAVLRDVLIELGIERNSERAVVRPKTFDRPELRYTVQRVEPSESEAALLGFLRGLPGRFAVPPTDFFRARGERTYSGLVFCPNVNGPAGISEVAGKLQPLLGAPPPMYSGSTAPRGYLRSEWEKLRRRNAALFKRNEAPLLISTKAFGMGIDKPNIRYVVHYGIPGSIESYYQEVGRGGRDRERAECGLVLIEYDERRARELLDDESDLEDARSEHEDIGFAESDDISRQLFFHFRSFRGIEEEASVLDGVLEEIGEVGRRRNVELPMGEDEDERQARERALHRLVVLGVLRDYLVEWGSKKFVLDLAGVTSDDVVDRLVAYVGRNQPGRVEAIAEEGKPCRTLDAVEAAEGCARILIEFVYDTIERSRRRSLREMWLAARESDGDPNVSFRRRILDYLSEGDISPTLEQLVDAPHFVYAEWQHELSGLLGADEARELRGNAARLLTSYPDHPGMLLARGFGELADDRGDLLEFTSAFESSVASARARYGTSDDEISSVVSWLVQECTRRNRGAAQTATLASASKIGIAEDVVNVELRAALDRPDETAPGTLALALAAALGEVLTSLDELASTKGVMT